MLDLIYINNDYHIIHYNLIIDINSYIPITPVPTIDHNNGNQQGILPKLGDLYFHKSVKYITTDSANEPPKPTNTKKYMLKFK